MLKGDDGIERIAEEGVVGERCRRSGSGNECVIVFPWATALTRVPCGSLQAGAGSHSLLVHGDVDLVAASRPHEGADFARQSGPRVGVVAKRPALFVLHERDVMPLTRFSSFVGDDGLQVVGSAAQLQLRLCPYGVVQRLPSVSPAYKTED